MSPNLHLIFHIVLGKRIKCIALQELINFDFNFFISRDIIDNQRPRRYFRLIFSVLAYLTILAVKYVACTAYTNEDQGAGAK